MWYGGGGCSRAQLSWMMATSSSEISRHQRSFHRSSNHLRQFLAGVVVHYVHVQLALAGQAGQSEIAAAKIADGRIDGIGAEEEIELGVQLVAHEKLDDDLLGLDLSGEPPQAGLVVVGRHPQRQLVAGTPPPIASSGEGQSRCRCPRLS